MRRSSGVNTVHFNDADLNLIKVLDALVREVSVARAARRLGVTPSAISHALGRLRLMLRDPVVVRSGRTLRLTPRALALAPVAASMCESARGLLTDAPDSDPGKWQDTLRILGSDYALAAWVFPALALARAEAPGLRIAAISLDAAEWERQLIDGAADFAVRDQQPRNSKLRCITLAQERYVVVMRPGHPFSRGRLDPDRYCRASHALVSVIGGGFHGAVDAQLAASGRTRNVMVSVPTFLAGIDLVRRSDLLLSLPSRLAQHYRGLVASRPLPVPSPSFDVVLIWHARTDGSLPHAWFRARIKKFGTAPDPPRLKSEGAP
jgi:DNA-binding transcriptional LysR family regulator